MISALVPICQAPSLARRLSRVALAFDDEPVVLGPLGRFFLRVLPRSRSRRGQHIGPYLELREKGNEFWKSLRPKSLRENTRYIEQSWQMLHDKPVHEDVARGQACASTYWRAANLRTTAAIAKSGGRAP